MFNWLKFKNWGIVRAYRDIENFNDWKRTIKGEEENPNSNFNRWKLKRSKLFDVYTIVSLEEADAQLHEAIKRTKVMEMLNPVHRYLDESLGFAGSLSAEFNQFVDDENTPTLSYLIVYRFIFEKFSLLWLVKNIVIIAGLLFVILHFDLIQLLIVWVSNLI